MCVRVSVCVWKTMRQEEYNEEIKEWKWSVINPSASRHHCNSSGGRAAADSVTTTPPLPSPPQHLHQPSPSAPLPASPQATPSTVNHHHSPPTTSKQCYHLGALFGKVETSFWLHSRSACQEFHLRTNTHIETHTPSPRVCRRVCVCVGVPCACRRG